VRDTYDLGDRIVVITTDRQSAFDRLLAAIPFKGQASMRLLHCAPAPAHSSSCSCAPHPQQHA